jgi:hypothetical protein
MWGSISGGSGQGRLRLSRFDYRSGFWVLVWEEAFHPGQVEMKAGRSRR